MVKQDDYYTLKIGVKEVENLIIKLHFLIRVKVMKYSTCDLELKIVAKTI